MIKAKNSLEGKLNVSIVREYPELENITITPTLEEQNLKSEKYGFDEVIVEGIPATDLEVTPTTEKQIKTGIFKEVTVNAIKENILDITPAEETQSKTGIYTEVNVQAIQTEEKTPELNFSSTDAIELTAQEGAYLKKVTINKPVNLKPENIKSGENVCGVVGSLADTHDADATADDILLNKTAYVANTMLRGTFKPLDTSDATATAGDILKDKTAYVNGEKIEGTIQEYDGSFSGNVSSGVKITDASYLFFYDARIDYLNDILQMCKNIKSAYRMFGQCTKVTEIDLSNIDTSNVTTFNEMFCNCTNLTKVNLSNFNTSKVTNMLNVFSGCPNITELDLNSFDTSNVTTMSGMFNYCRKLTKITGLLDASSCTNISYIVSSDDKLVDFEGLKNLGKAYTQKTNNYNYYKLDLSSCKKLTHESLISVINNLYNLNLSYDVANGGILYTQSLVLGSINLAKLTAEEIAIATNKGWTVS